jgi:two-component system nitrate/nitrite response regulator NarL
MKLLIVDDHPIVLDGLAALLASADPEIVVLTAGDAPSGLKLVEDHPDLDVVLLDLRLPGVSGHAALPEFGRLRPTLPIIILSSSEDPADVRRAIALGALGYMPKSGSRRALMSAIDLVMNGEIYVPALLIDGPVGETPKTAATSRHGVRLTDRQVEVLGMLSEGMANKVIATKLNLSEKTVKIHVTAIFREMHVINRTQAAAVGRQLGLIKDALV